MLPFGVSIAVLGLIQAATVALPRRIELPALARFRAGWWATIPALSIVAVTLGIRAASGTAHGLTWLALIAVPPLAAVALGGVARMPGEPRGGVDARLRLLLAVAVVPLFALAWADREGLPGQAAALALSALSCVTLGVLLAAVAPARWLQLGIVVMALVDTGFVISDLLRAPNDVLNAAAPPAGLPRLQSAHFGSALMGYGDFFVAGVFGALLAAAAPRQRRAALLTAALALAFDLLFLAVRELPATVPVALALIVFVLAGRRSAEEHRGRREQLGVKQLGLAQRLRYRHLLDRGAAQGDHAAIAPGGDRVDGGHAEARG